MMGMQIGFALRPQCLYFSQTIILKLCISVYYFRNFLFCIGRGIASKVVMFLPRNVDINQLAEMSLSANPPWSLEVFIQHCIHTAFTCFVANICFMRATPRLVSCNRLLFTANKLSDLLLLCVH